MDTRSFNELHDARYKHVASVAYRVYLDLFSEYVLVYQYRLVLIYLYGSLEVLSQLRLISYYLHRASAEYERRPYEHRISDLSCSLDSVFDLSDRMPRRLRDPEFLEDLLESVSVLGPVDSLAVRTDELYASLHQRLRKVDSGLASERCDDAFRLLKIDYRHDILSRQRLKVELVCSRVVSRYCLRVVVDDYGLVACAPYGLHGVYRRIVELNALTDPYRTCAQYDYLLLVRQYGLVLSPV